MRGHLQTSSSSTPYIHSHSRTCNRTQSSNVSLLAKLFLVPLLFLTSGSALANESVVWLPYPEDGVTLGQGFDILRNLKTPAVCIDYVPVEDAGLETSYDTFTLNSFTDVFSSLDIHSSGALDMSIFRASSKLHFANKIKTTSIGQQFMFNANILRGALYASPQESFKRGANHPNSRMPNVPELPLWPRVKFRQDLGKIENFDFSTHCGHGFVSAIVTGIELNAAITTSGETSAHTAKLSGSLKLEALEGLIKGSGSIEGKSEAVKSLETSQLKSFILGGENYSLPTTIDKLREFVIGLPVLADQYPRPVRIAISPYSSLTTGSGFNVFHNASSLRHLIYSYFAAREARDRISTVLEDMGSEEHSSSMFIHDEVELFREAHEINRTMLELQELLAACRKVLSQENSKLSLQVDEAFMGNAGKTYRALENLSRDYPMDKKEIASGLYRGTPSSDVTKEMEKLDLAGCISGTRVRESVGRALQGYFFSLASIPIDLEALEDSEISTLEFRASIELLARSYVTEKIIAVDDLRASSLSHWAHCTQDLKRRVKALRLLGVNQSRLQLAVTEEAGLDNSCNEKFDTKWEEFSTQSSDSADENKEKTLAAMAIVREVLAREMYRKSIYPILQSMCRADIQYSLCAYSYNQTMLAVGKHVGMSRADVLQMARILSIQFDSLPTDKDQPSDPPVYRGPGCKLERWEWACK